MPAKLLISALVLILLGCASVGRPSGYEGRYEYEDGTTLLIAERPADGAMFAVINDARYPLTPVRPDVFRNGSGDEVVFERNAAGAVIGYRVAGNPLRRMLDAEARVAAGSWRVRPIGARDPYVFSPPRDLNDGLPVRVLSQDDPLRAHLTSLVQAAFDEEYTNLDSVLVYQDGALVFEQYFYQFDAATPHQQRSATKTLVALLVGAAIDRGLIPSLDVAVLPYFEGYSDLANVDARKRSITLRDLLTMQSGFDCNDWDQASPGNESRMAQTDDWARFILDLPMASEPGTQGAYCSGNVILAGRIVEIVSGRDLRGFADEVLFGPLGIETYDWDFRPDRSNAENFVQAWVRPRDMMKIGVMMAEGGVWQGRRVISERWISELMSPHSEIDDTPYGYFYWLRYLNIGGGRVEVPQATGNGGQKIILLREMNAVIVFTGGAYNQESDTNEVLARHILPALMESAAFAPAVTRGGRR